jgi:hypothetical protein
MSKRGRFIVNVASAGARQVADSETSKPMSTNSSETHFAGVMNGRRRITAFIGLSVWGQEVEYGRLLLSKREKMVEKSAMSFVTVLVPFLVLRNLMLPFSVPFSFLCNCIRFT